jgi:hypothetical protein
MSEHFTIAELTFSQTADRKGIDNTPSPAVTGNLNRLMVALERIRDLVGPVAVSSGYRSPALNAAVGGARDSAHVLGLAADITCKAMTPKALATMIRESDIEFDQLIYEGTWVHIGLAVGALRREVLTANFSGGRATYTRGIV